VSNGRKTGTRKLAVKTRDLRHDPDRPLRLARPGRSDLSGKRGDDAVAMTLMAKMDRALGQLGDVDFIRDWAQVEPGEFMRVRGSLEPRRVAGVEGEPIRFERIERIIVDAADTDGPDI
jgi:hypothetical protein